MKNFENYSESELDNIACQILTDEQYELEYQGLYLLDKIRYMNSLTTP